MGLDLSHAAWLRHVTDEGIATATDVGTFERGLAYAEQDMVGSLVVSREGAVLLGTVRGSRDTSYQTLVTYEGSDPMSPGPDEPEWFGRCSCPVGAFCKHVVAVLLVARERAGGLGGGGGAASAAPWREVFARLRADTQAEVHPGSHDDAGPQRLRGEVEAGIVIERTMQHEWGSTPRADWRLRVVRRTRAGTWSRQVPWTEIVADWATPPVVDEQRQALERLWAESEKVRRRDAHDPGGSGGPGGSGARRARRAPPWAVTPAAVPDYVSLAASPSIYPLLLAAQRQGVSVLLGKGASGAVELSEQPVVPEVSIEPAQDVPGAVLVRVATAGLVPGRRTWFAGVPACVAAVETGQGHLTLQPVDDSLGLSPGQLHHAMDGVLVPEGEQQEFLDSVFPLMRARARVRSSVRLHGLPDAAEPGSRRPGRPDLGWARGGGETSLRPPEPAVTVHARVGSPMPGQIAVTLALADDGEPRLAGWGPLSAAVARRPMPDVQRDQSVLRAATSLQAVPGAVTTNPRTGLLTLAREVVLDGLAAVELSLLGLAALEEDPLVTLEYDDDFATAEVITEAPVIRLSVSDPRAPSGSPGAGRREGQGEDEQDGGQDGGEDRGEQDGPDVDVDNDWFSLGVTVEVGGEVVPLPSLLSALRQGAEVLWLESGAWLRLDHPDLQALRELLDEARELQDRHADGDEVRLSPVQLDLWAEFARLGLVESQAARWEQHVQALSAQGPAPQVPAGLAAVLRPYQLEGYHWLCRLWDARLGGILADDMGLGKTMQVIAAVTRAVENDDLRDGPVLVVSPTSVVGTWVQEFETFAPGVRVGAVTATERKSGRPLAELADEYDVIVTSFAVVRIDETAFRALGWSGVVIDEAQFVKNRQAKTHIVLRRLSSRFTLAVTGTPLENSLMDLWALLSLTAAGLYPRPDEFTRLYRRPIESGARPDLLDRLRRRIRPLMLRRTKEQVALDLPPKQVQVVPVPHNAIHGHIYDQHLARERQRVLGMLDDPEANRVEILAALTRLRQLALDPALVDAAHEGKAVAAKIEYLVERLRELAAEGHRALVFSQFTSFLRRVEARLGEGGIVSCYLDGTTPNRQRVIREFKQGGATAFLISLKAGGFGLTLTEADYVFVLDPWWNPAAEAQAIDRAHRIGQDKAVMVYRLVSAGTIEEKVIALQERKRDLFNRVIDDGGSLSGAITAADVRTLLEE